MGLNDETSSKRIYANTPPSKTTVASAPVPTAGTADPHALQETLRHSQEESGSASCGSHFSFPLGPSAHKALFVPPQVSVSPKSYGSSVIQILLIFRSQVPRGFQSLCWILGWEVCCRA